MYIHLLKLYAENELFVLCLGADSPENVDLVALKDTTFEHNNDSDSGYFMMTS